MHSSASSCIKLIVPCSILQVWFLYNGFEINLKLEGILARLLYNSLSNFTNLFSLVIGILLVLLQLISWLNMREYCWWWLSKRVFTDRSRMSATIEVVVNHVTYCTSLLTLLTSLCWLLRSLSLLLRLVFVECFEVLWGFLLLQLLSLFSLSWYIMLFVWDVNLLLVSVGFLINHSYATMW